MPDGPALLTSRVTPGDRVLDINGVSLEGSNAVQVCFVCLFAHLSLTQGVLDSTL